MVVHAVIPTLGRLVVTGCSCRCSGGKDGERTRKGRDKRCGQEESTVRLGEKELPAMAACLLTHSIYSEDGQFQTCCLAPCLPGRPGPFAFLELEQLLQGACLGLCLQCWSCFSHTHVINVQLQWLCTETLLWTGVELSE